MDLKFGLRLVKFTSYQWTRVAMMPNLLVMNSLSSVFTIMSAPDVEGCLISFVS